MEFVVVVVIVVIVDSSVKHVEFMWKILRNEQHNKMPFTSCHKPAASEFHILRAFFKNLSAGYNERALFL